MDRSLILRTFTSVSIIYLTLCTQTGQTNSNSKLYRQLNSPNYYSHKKSGSPGAPGHLHQPRAGNHEIEHDEQEEGEPEGIMNFAQMADLSETNNTSNSKEVGTKDAAAEEKLNPKPDPIQSRAVKTKSSKKDGFGLRISEKNCGTNGRSEERIVGGTDAAEGAYPWIVAILKDGEAWCGGTIINDRWIITASHCFIGDSAPEESSWAIRVGTINRNSGKTYKIAKVITHERFNLDNMLNSDIALMKTTKPIKMTTNVKPICLPKDSYEEPQSSKLIVTGWGAVKFDDENQPVILQEVSLNLVKKGECAKKYDQKSYTLYKSQLCTWNYKQDACQGDSGGPAIEYIKGIAYLVGIVSYGSTCADDFPGVYTEVSYFLSWISSTMKAN